MSAATITLFNESGHALILKRSAEDRWRPGQWDLPGGTFEPNESPEDVAVRECNEETSIYPVGLVQVATFKVSGFGTITTFMGEAFYKNPILSYEHDDYEWINEAGLVFFRFIPYAEESLRRAFEMYNSGGAVLI
jgi:8-oxo-dGTP pyrophosphatase MutT (NUDIX family)